MSVLQNPEVRTRYGRNYVAAEVDFGELKADDHARQETVKRLNAKKWRPVLVFLDSQGKEVYRLNRGLKGKEQALLIDKYVSERHYLKHDFQTFVDLQDD